MPKNPYLETEDLPISTEEPERVNPYLLARENPYLEAAEVPIFERGVEPTLFQRGKEAVTEFFRRDPGLGPLTEEDYAAFKPADIPIPGELAVEPTVSEYGLRADGTEKGPGFLGPLQRPDGKISTELSIGVNLDGEETEIPCLVPTLEQNDVDYLLGGGEPTEAIVQKAVDHARMRISEGESPFAQAEPIDPTLAMAGLTPEEAALGRPISAITGKPIPTPEEEAAAGRAAMAIIPYGFASAVRGVVPPALEQAVMDPLTKAIVGKEYVSPIDEALKIGEYLPEGARAAVGVPAHMVGAIVPLGVSFKTANAIMKTVGLPADLVLRTGPVMDRIAGHVARGGLAGAVYGGLEAGTPKGMAEDAAFFGALEGGLGVVGGIFRKIFSANWYRNLEVKERGLVVQSLDDMLNRGYSEGEILRQWDNPAWRAEALARRMEVEPVTRPTAKDIAKEAIREELIKRPEAPVTVIPEEPIPAIPPTEIVPEVLPITPEPVPEFPSVLEEPVIERKPILSTYGTPWKTEARASLALRSKKLKDMGITEETHEVMPVEDGFGVVKKAEEITEPEVVPEIEISEKLVRPKAVAPIWEESRRPSDKDILSARKIVQAEKTERRKIIEETGFPQGRAYGLIEKIAETPTTKEIKVEKLKPAKPIIEVPPVKKEIPIEPIKPEAIAIPEFKNTEEALAFGKTATSEQIEALKIKRDESLSKSDVLKAKGDLQGAMDEATKGQFFREAIESAEKKVIELKKPKEPITEVLEEKPLHEMTLVEIHKKPDVLMSSELKELHDHKARTLGFEKVGGSFVEGYLKKLAEIAEKTDMPAAMAAYEALSTYKKGNITQASLDAEKILGKLHKAEKKTLTPDKISEVHKKDIRKALKSGELTPEKYAELHEKDYGPLAEFMPEAVKAPPEVPEIKEIPEVPKILKAPEKVVKPVPEVPEVERKPLIEIKARLLANIKTEKGSSELINDLSRLGADAMRRGHTTYKAFTAEMKTELSSVWEKIKSLIRKAYFAAKKILKSERGAIEIGKPPKPAPEVERKRPWLTKSQKERRAKKKAIKEKQLKIENAKEAKEQIHGMIRDRRQNLNLSAYETNLFVNDIEQQTTKTQREIIPFIIEKTDIPESLNRPDLEKTYKKDKDNLAPIALQVKQHFDAGWLKMKENIPDMSAEQIENYVTHIWDLSKGQKRIVTNWFTTQNRFLKKRYIETLREGIEELGLTPKVLDISEIIRIHDGVASRAIENVKFVEGLKGLKHEGMPLIARADLAPQNWVYFDHPALRRGLVIPGKLKTGEKVSPELSGLLEEMGVAIGRRISPVAWGKPVGKKGEYISGEPPEIRFQRFMSSRTIAHELGHHLDDVLGLGYKFLNNYASELYEINRERIESRIGEIGKYGEAYVRSTEEQIAEFFATLFTDASKAYRIAPNATADALSRLRQDEVLSKLIDFDFEKHAKNLIEEQLNTLVKLPIKVHPDLEKPLKVIFESRIDHPVIQAYEVINGVLKKTNLSLSLFHHGALGETGIAIMGPRKVLNIYFNPVKIYKAMAQGKFDVFEKEPIARRWIGAGLQVGATADVPVNMIQSKLNNLARKTKNAPLINKTTEFIRTFNEVWDKALWNYLHDTLKLYACESLGTKIDPTKDMMKQEQEITQFVNDTFGGQNWDTLMISPKSLQIMTWSLLSADWTTSTVRQALSPTGIGRAHKETIGMRRKLGAYFWIKAGLYFGVGINLLNYTFREWDEKENPKYYEGMGKRTILDKTMVGNTMGHKTHLFVGRYEDGTERYIRWGKQFRELPELFFDDTGFSPISATLKKVGGKLAPVVQLTSKITTGVSPSGFRDEDIYGKKGWDRVYGIGKSLIKSPLPFATRTLFQEGKEFHITDLAMPSSKGMTRWKSINLFKHAIIKKDDRLLKETYQFTLMNNLPAYTLFSTALTILKAESTKEFNEGIKTIEDVKKLLDKVDDPKDLIRLGNKYKRIQKENVDRKIGMDLLDQAILDIKKYELIKSE